MCIFHTHWHISRISIVSEYGYNLLNKKDCNFISLYLTLFSCFFCFVLFSIAKHKGPDVLYPCYLYVYLLIYVSTHTLVNLWKWKRVIFITQKNHITSNIHYHKCRRVKYTYLLVFARKYSLSIRRRTYVQIINQVLSCNLSFSRSKRIRWP